jgi:uncharacterized protein YjbI with pentapeptide repeats
MFTSSQNPASPNTNISLKVGVEDHYFWRFFGPFFNKKMRFIKNNVIIILLHEYMTKSQFFHPSTIQARCCLTLVIWRELKSQFYLQIFGQKYLWKHNIGAPRRDDCWCCRCVVLVWCDVHLSSSTLQNQKIQFLLRYFIDFQNVDFQNVDFQNVDFQNVNFRNVDFQNAKRQNAILSFWNSP